MNWIWKTEGKETLKLDGSGLGSVDKKASGRPPCGSGLVGVGAR